MFVTADSEPLRSVYDYAAAFTQAGFSVIPVPRGQKGATIRWSNYQKASADPAQLVSWFHRSDPPNLALIMGHVSGNAVALDVDHAGFAAFIEEYVLPSIAPAALPLCKRTGSGKLHLIVRSVEPVFTTILRLRGTNETLADIKGEGGYVVAAPSIHPSGGTYRILMGDIGSVPRFQNARTVFNQLEALYAQYLGTTSIEYLTRPKMQVLAPLEGEDRRVLEQEIKHSKLTYRIRKAILDGAFPGDGDWTVQPSHSEIDFSIVIALREQDWTAERIEWVFATFPIGEGCYRNSQRAHHGTSYLTKTIENVNKRINAKPTHAEVAQGKGWQITKIIRTEYNPPKYELDVTCPDGVDRKLSGIFTEDILSDRKMQAKLAMLFSSVPQFRTQHVGRGYIDFANALLEMANREAVPQLATEEGFLQVLLQEFLRTDNVRKYTPDHPEDLAAGWQQDNLLHVRGRSAIRYIEQRMRKTVATQEVWNAARSLGGYENQVSPFDGHIERVWTFPLSVLK